MPNLPITIPPQYVPQVQETATFKRPNKPAFEGRMHRMQQIMRDEFEKLPLITEVIAPTGTGKSYAFAFPCLKYAGDKYNKKCGLIILPTNTLIDELHGEFSAMFPDLNIVKATGKSLDEADKKGSKQRWEALEEMASQADLMITNPDILNYAMLGGYDENIQRLMKRYTGNPRFKMSGGKTYWHFLHNFDYIIYDEFHLYDEEQLASIMLMLELRQAIVHESARFFFVTATPEEQVATFLQEREYDFISIEKCLQADKSSGNLAKTFTRLQEEIVDSPDNARCIHGSLEVDFTVNTNISEVLNDKIEEIAEQKEKRIKVLIIFNALYDLQRQSDYLRHSLPDHIIHEVSGYEDQGHHEADVILSTSKAEVGANFGVDYCIMQAGFNWRSFLQRFGRTARGEMSGKIIVSLTKKEKPIFNKLSKAFADQNICPYYDFAQIIKNSFARPDYYAQKVSPFMGQFLFALSNKMMNTHEFTSRTYFKKVIEDLPMPDLQKAQYKYFSLINSKVNELSNARNHDWNTWWQAYLNTYLSFRGSSVNVQVKDLELDAKLITYSKEWVLQNKAIIDVENKGEEGKEILVVDGLREEQDKDLLFETDTIPFARAQHNRFFKRKEKYEPEKLFKRALKEIQKNETIGPNARKEEELIDSLKGISKYFSTKRLNIIGVQGSDGESVIF
ncbi:type I-D CRISPR-associated helicase Cas3' [Aureibacter tunicatorum]|uniref:CRISPR-associated endonuclease/helicase Cas3 n=1 Tax=Aureibacter tunicatorum TaxID=866807 RepID=A0AAE3XST9_9BACT|nr:type I-D CRISPR-associated helicase Cas3' [Aureibacter tunicatorum]MDR6241942.1 CRISPR-associated endonuclease/helicase Cas3 [Aureibacter tunicatorum]BDD07548.1 hypothetical protein AUTU_50310 [Aureibacter tunicatorum]